MLVSEMPCQSLSFKEFFHGYDGHALVFGCNGIQVKKKANHWYLSTRLEAGLVDEGKGGAARNVIFSTSNHLQLIGNLSCRGLSVII